MTDLLTRAEYGAIAAGLDLPASPFVDGRYRPGTGPAMPVLNPATGETLTTIACGGGGGCGSLRSTKAREAFEDGRIGHASTPRPSARMC